MNRFNFAAASRDEDIVYGAQRPGYSSPRPVPDTEVTKWIEFIQQQGIGRVCCLLESQLSLYASDLLEAYRASFGEQNVCWAPIEDFQLVDEKLLTGTILPCLGDSVRREKKVVVHCSAGSGRTGHVLAAWMVFGRGMTNEEAMNAVIEMGRNPHEATLGDPTREAKLESLLDASRAAAGGTSR